MLKAYFIDSYYKIDDEKWQGCGKRGYIVRDDSEPIKLVRQDKVNFETAYAKPLDGIACEQTIFRKRPYIKVYHGWFDENPRCLKPGDFKEFSYMDVFTERNDCSLEWIMKHASADQTIQYMKERGMTVCPLQ